ncbi:hypothetical protein lerEdw1_006658 [Lerista edwardsae]|nr:hypothetical protein lerEdw1_006658 [Lerista edwardsae]
MRAQFTKFNWNGKRIKVIVNNHDIIYTIEMELLSNYQVWQWLFYSNFLQKAEERALRKADLSTSEDKKTAMDMSVIQDSLSEAITAFGLDLYHKLNKKDTCKSIFFSPMSISTVLSMVLLGARGRSKTQMEKVLHFDQTTGCVRPPASERTMSDAGPGHQEESSSHCQPTNLKEEGIASEFRTLLAQLNKLSKGYQLDVANNLFMQKGYDFLPQYLASVEEIYGAILETVDFTNPEKARQMINLVVDKQTKGNIKELFAPGVIGPQAVLVLANAVYFKATWQHQFDPKRTIESTFRLNENETKPVHMMYQRGKFKLGHAADANAQILCLPYVDEVLSMIILLPNDIRDLEQVEKAMTCETLARWISPEDMGEKNVKVYLPRFKLEDTFDLNMSLEAMGMVDVFDRATADLTGMSSSRQLFLSKVIHKAYVDVNEVGTEAAAATGAVVSVRSAVSYELFLADHPFLFWVLHNPTKTILFLGKLCSP